jgi:hypothetical protein
MANWFVDPDAEGLGNGETLANAYTSLQAAENAKRVGRQTP